MSDLTEQLQQRVVTVTFRKVNGEMRTMECTKNLEFVPPSKWPKDKIKLSEETKQSTHRVYDVKAQAWRSFLAGNVLSWV